MIPVDNMCQLRSIVGCEFRYFKNAAGRLGRKAYLSDHMIWMLQSVYQDQVGQVLDRNHNSREFSIRAGVRRGCVLSLTLLFTIL